MSPAVSEDDAIEDTVDVTVDVSDKPATVVHIYPPPTPMAMQTRPQDWAPAARAILFPQHTRRR